MFRSIRYAFAVAVNVAMPAAAYRLAFGHYGLEGALVASAIPLVVWMGIDIVRFGHFDALSALALAAIALSLLIVVSVPEHWIVAVQDPLVSGLIGVLFLLSLGLRRPIVFYLARSTMAREKQGKEYEFDEMWRTRPDVVRSIRLMTVVWGVGFIGENVVRLWITYGATRDSADRISMCVRYGTYLALTAWTVYYRRVMIRRRETSGVAQA
ncbi:VC0807 family protein [Pararobbsia silviterrae]|uniref:Transmembrane protein n=1 Tax=Pararobbsia silviterrae TaxID=1792498 RepID=A0A494X630_9BURK|nr:VC0807 family protein [Pararobbsia silviterrae]RKP46145.1 hypothetical protein D7S86_24790 [Pararobbsia silviterrae]